MDFHYHSRGGWAPGVDGRSRDSRLNDTKGIGLAGWWRGVLAKWRVFHDDIVGMPSR